MPKTPTLRIQFDKILDLHKIIWMTSIPWETEMQEECGTSQKTAEVL